MNSPDSPITISPRDYELAVKAILDKAGEHLVSYESVHLKRISGTDGDYVIDVLATFSAFGADFVVLVECKCEVRRIERSDVQLLKDKVHSVGAHKGIMFSVSGFQSGAIEYADVHGIALVRLANGSSTWFTKSAGPPMPPPTWVNIPQYVGWWHHGKKRSVLSPDDATYTRRAIGLPDPGDKDINLESPAR